MSSWKRVLVLGTGTGIGKTAVTRALVQGRSVALGLKPIESGLTAQQIERGIGADGAWVGNDEPTRGLYLFQEPLSPHLAARLHHVEIEVEHVATWLDSVERAHPARQLVVESAGGAFSPLGPNLFNADLVEPCRFDRVVLVAWNRLGVLHDVFATCLALRSRTGRGPDCVVLNDGAGEESDPTPRDTNLAELRSLGEALGLGACVRFPRFGTSSDAAPIWAALER